MHPGVKLANSSGQKIVALPDATVILTPKERADLQKKYQRAQDRMRDQMVSTWLMQGVSAERMASLLDLPVGTINEHFENAIDEIRARMQEIPEGPFLLAQVVGEGYHRAGSIVLRTIQMRIDALLKDGEPTVNEDGTVGKPGAVDDGALNSYLKTFMDTQDRMLKTMGKLGFVEFADTKGSGRSQGGVRGNAGAPPTDPYRELLANLTDEEKARVQEGAKRFAESAVEPREAEVVDE